MNHELISIVVPVYNEEGALDDLVREIREVTKNRQWRIEIVFVDDGSTDRSWERIRALAEADPAIAGIRFQTNAGKAAALMAGFTAARGDIVFSMDADLQDPPSEMPRMLETLDHGWDVVSGWKRVRHDPWHKVYPSRVFNRIIGLLTGVELHDHVCGLKCFRGPVVKQLRLYGEFHRFMGVLAASRGYRVTEIPTLHRARTSGVGKYGFARFAKGFLDLLTVCCLTRYGWRPQHLIGVVGLWMIALTFGLHVLAFILPFLALPLLWLISIVYPGVLLIAIGLVAQLVVDRRRLDEQYTIAERIGWCDVTDDAFQHTLPS